jgi:hypothetical protein
VPVLLAVALAIATLIAPIDSSAATLHAGDVVIVVGQAVIAYSPHLTAGVQLSYGQNIHTPVHVAVDARYHILVTDGVSGVVDIDPSSGSQTILLLPGQLGGNSATGICAGADGRIFVALSGPSPGVTSIVPGGVVPVPITSGGLLTRPGGMTLGADGMLYVCEEATPVNDCGVNVNSKGSIVRVDQASGAQTRVATACAFWYPFDIASVGSDELWTTQTGQISGTLGCILRTRISDGSTSESNVGYCRSSSIAAASDGSVYWGDCEPIHRDCFNVFTGHWPSGEMLWNIAGPMALVPDLPVPVRHVDWGTVKILYR